METKQGYFNDLKRLLAAMPLGMLDMHVQRQLELPTTTTRIAD